MLVSFSVANFRSFGEEVTLNMVASNKLTDHPNHLVPIGDTGKSVLRAAIVYGANAAGKSNLVKAMDVAQKLIREQRQGRILFTPFRFAPPSERKPSSFEFRFMIKDRVFTYGFDVAAERFSSEWLTVLKGDDEIELFTRNEQGAIDVNKKAGKQFPDDHQTFATLHVLQQLQIRNDQLFLNRALSLPDVAQGDTLRAILKWFTTDLVVVPINTRSVEILDRLHGDQKFREFCSEFLSNVGTGIGGLDVHTFEREISTDWERRAFSEPSRFRRYSFGGGDADIIAKPEHPGVIIERKLLSEHHVAPNTYQLPFSEESDGTQSLLHLLPMLAAAPDESRVIVLDELDRSLHPKICWEFVKFFSESSVGARRQLIATTHEAHLLNQELLRRDEYWFAEKDERQQTQLYSLSEFNIRNDLKLEKGYLNGRFGAIPFIGGMSNLENLLKCNGLEGRDAADEAPP